MTSITNYDPYENDMNVLDSYIKSRENHTEDDFEEFLKVFWSTYNNEDVIIDLSN